MQFTDVYFNMSVGDSDARGPWNEEPTFEFREATLAVDGGSGSSEVELSSDETRLVEAAAARLQSDVSANPVTGAMLGMRRTPGDPETVDPGDFDPKAARKNAATKPSLKVKSRSGR
jgi:Mn-containing catalase